MKKWRPFLIGTIGVLFGAILIYARIDEAEDSQVALGIFIAACSIFYMLMVGAIRLVLYLLKQRGYSKE